MKKVFLTILLLCSFALVQAQRDSMILSPSLKANNEIKLNILYTILGSPELTYERILNDKNAVGISAFLRATETVKSDFSFQIAPYFRHYFGTKKASGFFLEGHAAVSKYDEISSGGMNYFDPYTNQYYQIQTPKETFFGLGAALGAKFLTRKGFTGEIYLGATKSFTDVVDFLPRAGLTLGKRF